MTRLLACALLCFAAVTAPAAAADTTPPDCKGYLQLVRVVKIKEGQEAVFRQFAHDIQMWFRNRGRPDRFEIGRLLPPPGQPDARAPTEATHLLIRSYLSLPVIPEKSRQDAEWETVEQEFSASAVSLSVRLACISDLAN